MATLREMCRLLNAHCDQMSALMSRAHDDTLPRCERWAVRLHLLYCSACRRYRRQLQFITQVTRRLAAGTGEDITAPPRELSPDARERIKRSLNG